MSNPKRIIVLGASGMLGHMAIRVLSTDFNVLGVTRGPKSTASPLSKFLSQENWKSGIDACNIHEVRRLVDEYRPDVLLNCVGLVKQKMDSSSYIASISTNALLPHQLAGVCEEFSIKFIQISTDCVFTCDSGVKKQDDRPNATDLYGITKYLGEVNYGSALTIRTSIVGRQIVGEESLFEWILSQRNQIVYGYKNALYTGLTTMALAEVISSVIKNNFDLRGVWQVASESINKFELVKKLNDGLDLGIDVRENTDFFCDRRLDGTHFQKETGIRIPTWAEMIDQFVQDQVNYN